MKEMTPIIIAHRAVDVFDVFYYAFLWVCSIAEMFMADFMADSPIYLSISNWVAAPIYFALLSYSILLLFTFIAGALAASRYRDRRMFAECRWNPLMAAIVFLIARVISLQTESLQSLNIRGTSTLIFMLIALAETLIRAIPPINLRSIRNNVEEQELMTGWLKNSRKSYWIGIPIFVAAAFVFLPISGDYSHNLLAVFFITYMLLMIQKLGSIFSEV